jgi:ABC-type polysaccharide/polyol phosphate export permease
VFQLFRNLFGNKRLIKELVLRDLKARYVGSAMGFFWSVIYPIMNLFVYTFVFMELLGTRFGDEAGIKDVAIWMLAGIVVWTAFAETLSRATNCLVENANLIQKVVFPSGVLPIYLTLSSIVNMSIGLPVVLLGVLWFGYISPTQAQETATGGEQVVEEELVVERPAPPAVPEVDENGQLVGLRTGECNYCGHQTELICPNDHTAMRVLLPVEGRTREAPPVKPLAIGLTLLFLPVLMLLQALFTSGVALFLSAFNLILRDTYHLVGVFTTVWMFATPIFYPPFLLTKPEHNGRYDFILEWNPMYWLITSYREVLLFNRMPNVEILGSFTIAALVIFTIGASFFQSQRDKFPDLL